MSTGEDRERSVSRSALSLPRQSAGCVREESDIALHLVLSHARFPCGHCQRTNRSIRVLQVLFLVHLGGGDDMAHPFLEGLKGSELKERRALLSCES